MITATHSNKKKVNTFLGMLLLIISILLSILTLPLGVLFAIIQISFKKGATGLGDYALKIAISIDQLGNVTMQHALNALLLKKHGYRFGNRDETISSVLGKNQQAETVTKTGLFFVWILDKIDKQHSLDSIDYNVEPNKHIIDKVAWIYVKDGKILSTISKGKTTYYIPGGKREPGESDLNTLSREIQEELTVKITPETLQFVGFFEAQADGHSNNINVQMLCYTAAYTGTLQPSNEIESMAWLSYSDRHKSSAVDQLIFEYLHQKQVLR